MCRVLTYYLFINDEIDYQTKAMRAELISCRFTVNYYRIYNNYYLTNNIHYCRLDTISDISLHTHTHT